MLTFVVWHCHFSLSLSHWHCILLRSQMFCSVLCVPVLLLPKSVLHLLLCSSVVQPELPTDWWTFEVCYNMHENRKSNMLTLVLENLTSRCFWSPYGAPSKCRTYLESLGQPFNSYVGYVSPTCSTITRKATFPFIRLPGNTSSVKQVLSWFACLVYFC